MKSLKTTDVCGKCDGKGSIQAFRNINNGICYACSGEGVVSVQYLEPTAQKIDAELESRRSEYFANLTLDKFNRLPYVKRESMVKWIESKYFSDRELHYRFMEVFQPSWIACR